jgi:DNA-binding HxlR family transcriptional regulator
LERDGFISKKIFAESLPRVEYHLTWEGKKLVPVLKAMSGWGMQKGREDGALPKKFTMKK